MSGGAYPYLICYDIRHRKRLLKVHRFLKKRAIPLQYSVFIARLNARQRQRLVLGLRAIIHEQCDDVRFYPLPKQPDWCGLGQPMWGEGMSLPGFQFPPLLDE